MGVCSVYTGRARARVWLCRRGVCVLPTCRESGTGPRLYSSVTVWACGGVRSERAPSRAAPACRLSLMHDGEEREKEKKASQCHDSASVASFFRFTHTHTQTGARGQGTSLWLGNWWAGRSFQDVHTLSWSTGWSTWRAGCSVGPGGAPGMDGGPRQGDFFTTAGTHVYK